MTNEEIERVARAICAATNIAMDGVTETIFDDPDFVIPANRRTDGKSLARWELYVEQAKAAIKALRPSQDDGGPLWSDYDRMRDLNRR